MIFIYTSYYYFYCNKNNNKMSKVSMSSFSYDDKKGYEYRLNGLLHRDDGPARIYSNGTTQWYQNGLLHRRDGPAVEANHEYCKKIVYYQHGEKHNEKGPAYVETWRFEHVIKYFFHDELHHLQGPAYFINKISRDRTITKQVEQHYYIYGKYLTQDKFKKYTKIMKKFIQKCKEKYKQKKEKSLEKIFPKYLVKNISYYI